MATMSIAKVIGLGLNKTGTKTLQCALRRLGYERLASCRRDLLLDYRNGDPEPALAVVEQHDLCEDWPYPLMYAEIFERFGPSARYVLTLRKSPSAWLDSLKAHSLRTDPDFHCRTLAYGYAYPHGAEAEHLRFYERHEREVTAFFAARGASASLLQVCWERGDGWDRLCGFLGLPAPDEPFPHENPAFRPDPAVRQINEARIAEQRLRLAATAAAQR
jgi:hypothetical protein